ncbi:MAG TPA: hypothetical protein VK005_01065 [Acholeplasma sp.]|nr:hypothetical protein [Acholeplasma sp.]
MKKLFILLLLPILLLAGCERFEETSKQDVINGYPDFINFDKNDDIEIDIFVDGSFHEGYEYRNVPNQIRFAHSFKDLEDSYMYEYMYERQTNDFIERHYKNGTQFYNKVETMDEDTFYQLYSNQTYFNIEIDFNYFDKMTVNRSFLQVEKAYRSVDISFKSHPVIELTTETSTYEFILYTGIFRFDDYYDEGLVDINLEGKTTDNKEILISIHKS